MNKVFLFVIIGFLAVQNIESAAPKNHQRRVQPNAVQPEGDIQRTVVAKTEEVIKNAGEVLSGDLPDSKTIISKVEQTGQELVNNIKSFNDLIKKVLVENEGEINTSLKTLSDNLKQTRDDIEKKVLGKDGLKTAQQVRDAVNKGITEAASQIGKIGDTLKPEAEKIKNDLLAGAQVFLDKAEQNINELKTHVAENKQKN